MLFTVIILSLSAIIGESFANNIVPKNYDVQFSTDIESGSESYDGTVTICFDVEKEVGQLVLQTRNLTIKDVTLSKDEINFATKTSELPNGNLLLEFEDQLSEGNYHLKITFSGTASDSDVMFKGSYRREDDSVGHYLMSKPRKSDCHEEASAFPHFDEEYKATFKISVVHHGTLKAWSNMPLQAPPESHDSNGNVLSTFQETPRMHVFDVGFFVSDFETEQIDKLTVVARKGVLRHTQYSASVCNDLVKIMNNHTAIDYDGDVPDYVLIVVPRKLSHSNLTEFERKFVEEDSMMYDREKDDFVRFTQFLKSAGNNVMLQWFSNLIAPEEERLLQAFSNVYTYFNAEKIYPKEYMMMLYQVDVLQESLARDYERPSSVLNMFWLIVLDNKWGAVMKNLSKNRKPRTLTTAQLCSEAQNLWKEDYNLPDGTTLEAIFNQWMHSDAEPPVLNVQRLYSEGKVTLSQNGSEKILPYNFATQSSHFEQLGPFQWLTGRNETVRFDVSDDQWIIFNKEEFGFYRVNYDDRNWKLITQALLSNVSSIHPVSRMQLLDDALNFVENDLLDVSILLELLTYLRNEKSYDVWLVANNVLKTYYHYEIVPPKLVKDFLLHLVEPYYQSFASQSISQRTPQMELHLHSELAEFACWLGQKECLQQARAQFQQAVETNITVEPNWSIVTYCYGLQNANDKELEWLLNSQKSQLCRSVSFLSCVDNEIHLRRVLVELQSKTNQECIADFMAALDEIGFDMLHSLLRNDSELVNVLGSSTVANALEQVSKCTKSANTLELIDELKNSLDLHLDGKSSGKHRKNIWTEPKATEFIERYLKEVEKQSVV
ncbi:aminopeptidase N-like [Armigeres subalbatus]|uniref:aminopeptidase N-like n=1 Tax=Armigeres subalbatus TaxID=124917 RepID=UPI002ED3F173